MEGDEELNHSSFQILMLPLDNGRKKVVIFTFNGRSFPSLSSVCITKFCLYMLKMCSGLYYNKLFAVENPLKIALKLRLDGFICSLMVWTKLSSISHVGHCVDLDIGCIISDIYRIFYSLIGRRK